jgi:hypothetical protein
MIMSDVNDTALVKEILEHKNDEDYGDFIADLHYSYSAGDEIDFSNTDEIPEDWVFKIVEVEDSCDYDSYGNSHTDSAHVIISVTDSEGNTANYRLPGGYSSYEGWSWELDKLTRVTRQQRIITSWDWVA